MANTYQILNDTFAQMHEGQAFAPVTNAEDLISVGQTIISSATLTDSFLNTLCQRIGRTMIAVRAYKSKYSAYIYDNMVWGEILQKIRFEMPSLEDDPTYALTNGVSYDHYTVNKPSAAVEYYHNVNPAMFHITTSRVALMTAFKSEADMERFLSGVRTMIRNKLETVYEDLARTGLLYAVSETVNQGLTTQVRHVLTSYAADTGDSSLTASTAPYSNAFLRYLSGLIRIDSKRLEDLSTIFNTTGAERHTSKDFQKLAVIDLIGENMKSQVEYAAFHKDLVDLGNYTEVSYWQSIDDRFKVQFKSTDTPAEVIAFLSDRDAFGVYKEIEDVLTTPVNAAGQYYNTFYHIRREQLFDPSENAIVYVLD